MQGQDAIQQEILEMMRLLPSEPRLPSRICALQREIRSSVDGSMRRLRSEVAAQGTVDPNTVSNLVVVPNFSTDRAAMADALRSVILAHASMARTDITDEEIGQHDRLIDACAEQLAQHQSGAP